MTDYGRIWSQGQRNIRYSTDPNLAMGATDGEVQDCPIRVRGEPFNRGEDIPRGDVRIPSLPSLPAISPESSGRLQLAQWIASPTNPLTARVLVNRVWQHLVGQPLVATPDDFGSTGEPPRHPELLDHLAARFMADRWSLKRLIRTIMLSRTYRQSSAGRADGNAHDAANEFCWRMNRKRLELEPIRDSLLFVAGRLDFTRPQVVPMTGTGGKSSAPKSLFGLESPYRTVYLPVLRSLLPETYGVFDFPDPAGTKGKREVTTVAPQALFFMNDPMVAECAQSAARQLFSDSSVLQGSNEDQGRVRLAYLRLLSREPTSVEVSEALSLIAALNPGRTSNSEHYRWAALVQALMATGEFRYVP